MTTLKLIDIDGSELGDVDGSTAKRLLSAGSIIFQGKVTLPKEPKKDSDFIKQLKRKFAKSIVLEDGNKHLSLAKSDFKKIFGFDWSPEIRSFKDAYSKKMEIQQVELTALETKKDIARKSKLQQLADSRKIKRIEVANKRKESSSSRPVKKTSTKGQPVSDDSPLTSRYRVSRIESIPKQQRKSVKLDDLMRRLAKSEKKLLRQRLMSITPQGLLNDIDTFIHSDRLKNLPDKLLLKELTTGKVTSQTVCKYWQWDSVFASAVIYIESEVAAIDNLTVVPIDSASKGRNLKQPQSSSETNIAAKNKFNSKNINADAYKKRLKNRLTQ